MSSFTVTETMDVRHCPTCSMPYGITREFYSRLELLHSRGERPVWYCPAGHQIIFSGESELDKTRRERDRLKQEQARLIEDARAESRKRIAAEKKLKAQTKRVTAGVCIHCHRTFRQLAAHMHTKHPEMVEVLAHGGGTKLVNLRDRGTNCT